jgi:hypothetical protein
MSEFRCFEGRGQRHPCSGEFTASATGLLRGSSVRANRSGRQFSYSKDVVK